MKTINAIFSLIQLILAVFWFLFLVIVLPTIALLIGFVIGLLAEFGGLIINK